MPKVIAIAGMGLCGNAIFCRLIHLLATVKYSDDDVTILIFEPNPQNLATGGIYLTDYYQV
ncbi:hypothetical protein ACFORL_01705 [Legionella dresdenensis]|uniref:FAD-dependent urate hydroxylase HpyO FAD/NAD(P)-binding domain-containing protein n=1 Tax=Legionella dresdenensis TaxID=450200 RepID=A0ABV8CC41_9GAMM